MFLFNSFAKTPTSKIVVGAGLCLAGTAMLYVYFKTRDEEDENDAAVVVDSGKKKEKVKMHTMKLEIPSYLYAVVVGRNKNNIELVSENTSTTITHCEKDDSYIFTIQGTKKNVMDAKDQITKFMADLRNDTEEILVPQSVCNKITSRGGEILNNISRESLGKIVVEPAPHSNNAENRKITITGSQSQIDKAHQMIEEVIAVEEETKRSIQDVEQSRLPRRSPANSMNSSMSTSETSLINPLSPREKLSSTRNDDSILEVYVSAVANPIKFWIQMIGRQTGQLNNLINCMTEYYSKPKNQENHILSEYNEGQMVAAYSNIDGKYYRAKIVGTIKDDDGNTLYDLFFVDFGDSEYLERDNFFELRTDFLTLRFQAVECYLSSIKSKEKDPNYWTEEAIQKFCNLVEVGGYKKLTARVVSYSSYKPSSDSENLPIVGVELYDNYEGSSLNISEALIAQGVALPVTEDPLEISSRRSDSPLNSPVSHTTTNHHINGREDNHNVKAEKSSPVNQRDNEGNHGKSGGSVSDGSVNSDSVSNGSVRNGNVPLMSTSAMLKSNNIRWPTDDEIEKTKVVFDDLFKN